MGTWSVGLHQTRPVTQKNSRVFSMKLL